MISGAQHITGDLANKLAGKLGIKDFYSAHLLTYCDGSYAPNGTAPHPGRNVTFCSPKKAGFVFDPTAAVQNDLKTGISLLDDLHWPQEIQDGLNALHAAMRATFGLYAVGAALAGVLVLGSVAGVFSHGRLTALLDTLIALVSSLCLHRGLSLVVNSTADSWRSWRSWRSASPRPCQPPWLSRRAGRSTSTASPSACRPAAAASSSA